MTIDGLEWLLLGATREISLFAAIGLLIGGLDDALVDVIWLTRTIQRRFTVFRRHARATALSLPPPDEPGRIAIFVAAWHEAAVIGRMIETALARIDHQDYRIFVGTYPNDPDTVAAVRAVRDARVILVGGTLPGPTTKAECLNRCWNALCRDERRTGIHYKAVVLHDAEDVVHPLELRVFDRLIERFDFLQLPVLPLVDSNSPWIAGHYVDEFCEAHGRQLAVREALGAAIPAAGVGCALSRRAMAWIAEAGGGQPFDRTSLTEDYEIGLRLHGFGARAAFVALPQAPEGPPVAVRAYFPPTLNAAIRQKARWTIGISCAGWDRLRWNGGLAERWMRLRDRRAVIAAIILATAYVSPVLILLCLALGLRPQWPDWTAPLVVGNGSLLVWRLGMRFLSVSPLYGWREGCRAIPRVAVANVIAMAAAWRAMKAYVPGVVPAWDKTSHHFPDEVSCD